MRLTIPGRPQAKARNSRGETLDAAKTYLDHVRRAATHAGLGHNGPRHPDSQLALRLTFVYTTRKPALRILGWPEENIPNAHKAPELVLQALTGLAFTRVSQVNPLIVTRTVLTPEDCLDRYHSLDGATVIEIEE